MFFKKLKVSEWQQFDQIEIDFHDRLTVLTGSNWSGKTTILNLLAKHFGWDVPSCATPAMDSLSKVWKWATWWLSTEKKENENIIWFLEYSDQWKANLIVPQQSSAQYQIQIQNQKSIDCFFIPSHRSVFRYQPVNSIPTQNTINKRQAFDKVSNSTRQRYFGWTDQSSSFHMKETLISWNIFGQGNKDMIPNEKLIEYYLGFEKILWIILPKSIGFKKFAIRNTEVILECDSGDFMIDASSGGISAIIDIAWQIYMYSADEKKGFTVIVDEVENHLHPTMQRQILPDLLKAFPSARFIVSTHSPLIIWSVRESNVYALRYGESKRIVSQKLDLINKAKTASEILDEVLWVSFTMPIWAEEKLIQIVSEYSWQVMTKEKFQSMRQNLSDIGLERLMPEAISNLMESKND